MLRAMIAAIETFTRHPYGLVRVTADDGVQGWGQMARMDEDVCATLLHRHLAPHALGRDDDPEPLAAFLEAETYKYRGSHLMRALAGLDTALWDLRARRAGVPVCVLAGGRPRAVPVYGSALRRDTSPEAECERMLRLRDGLGLRAFKTKIGPRLNAQPGDHVARTRALIPALRRALGPDIVLLADANGSYRPAEAIAVGRQLEEHGYAHYEEPCPFWELEQTAEVAAALAIPVAGGEQDCDIAQFRRMIAMRAVDIVQPDIGYLGGFSRARSVAALAAAAGMPCTPHAPSTSLLTVFTLHLVAAIPNPGPFLERSIEDLTGGGGMYDPEPAIVDGAMRVPDGLGWGVTIRADWLAGCQRQESRLPR